jgi:hypothetical protein
MTNVRFNIYLALLAFMFVTMAYAADQNEALLRQLPELSRVAIALAIAAPVALSLLVFMLRVKELKNDEYQAEMLNQRMVYATMTSLLYSVVKGFTDQYGQVAATPFYVWPIIYWYLTFWFSSLFGPYKP